jgi:MoaA/NifB/PqqE/SkfB family radical SAM enzyme
MKPILLHYYVTTRCNAHCAFCDIWKEPAMPDAVLTDVSANLIQSRKMGCRFVDFTGGEPLLNKQLPEFLREAKRIGYITSVTTNCLLFPGLAHKFTGLIDLLHFSINADAPERHDAMRGVPSFAAVLESITVALQNKLIPDLLFTYTNENIADFEGVCRLADENKLIAILDPVFDRDGKDHVTADTHRKALEYAKRPGVYLNRAHLTLRRSGGNQTLSPLCRAVDSTIVLLPDNTLALPCFHHRIAMVPAGNNLAGVCAGMARQESAHMQGQYPFCEHCHINCYFDPSYRYMHNRLFIQSMTAKLRYAWRKYIIYHRSWPSTRPVETAH